MRRSQFRKSFTLQCLTYTTTTKTSLVTFYITLILVLSSFYLDFSIDVRTIHFKVQETVRRHNDNHLIYQEYKWTRDTTQTPSDPDSKSHLRLLIRLTRWFIFLNLPSLELFNSLFILFSSSLFIIFYLILSNPFLEFTIPSIF